MVKGLGTIVIEPNPVISGVDIVNVREGRAGKVLREGSFTEERYEFFEG